MSLRPLRRSSMGPETQKKQYIPAMFRFDDDVAKVSQQYSDGTAVAEFPTGDWLYKGMMFAIRCKAEIAGDTFEKHGVHYVKDDALHKYVKAIDLEINGDVAAPYTTKELIDINNYMGHGATSGVLHMRYGGPDWFTRDAAEDAYTLGTGDLDQLRVLFDLTSEWKSGEMFLMCGAEYARISRPIGYFVARKRTRYALGAAGEHTISDIPVNADISRIHILGDGLKHCEVIVDGQSLAKGHSWGFEALNEIYGRLPDALPEGFTVDMWRDRDFRKGLKSLERADQRKRGADIRLVLETLNNNTEVQVIVETCGPFHTQ